MTIDEIMKMTGAGRSTVYRWRSAHDFPAPDRAGCYDRASVEGWWSSNHDVVGRWPKRRDA